MDMPPIHMCAFLSHENQRLKTKIQNLKARIHHLENRIEKRTFHCEISCQTDLDLSPSKDQSSSKDEIVRLHRLLKSQNDLLKKYENENAHSSDGLIKSYEFRLKQCENEKHQAEQRARHAEERMEKFRERYERMKREISSLDENFFQEIEDLKFALQQANKLNEEYEKTVQMLSQRLGIVHRKK